MRVIKEKGKTIFICGKDKKKVSRKNQKEEKNLSVENNEEAGSASISTEEVD